MLRFWMFQKSAMDGSEADGEWSETEGEVTGELNIRHDIDKFDLFLLLAFS
jgi:hypothetical protein